MSKGILVAIFCLWFSVGVQAAVQYPPEKNPFEKLEKTLAKMSKKEKAKVLEKIYDFMIKREDYQTVPLIVMNKESAPDWLNTLLWETSNAGVAQTHRQINRCLEEYGAVKNKAGKLYPNACMFAGNIICTSDVPPKCHRDFIAQEKPGLICDDQTIKCNPNVLMTCNGDQFAGPICVDPKKAQVTDARKGPRITNACVTGYDGKIKMEDRAKEVAACADFREGGKVAQALEEIAKFCSTLGAADVDAKLRDMKKFDASVAVRTQKDQYKADWAGNNQDCLDMLNFLAILQDNKPTPAPVVTSEPPKPNEFEIACKEFPALCEGQDDGSTCGSYIYTPGNKQKNECIPVTITQEHNSSFKEVPSICNDEVKDSGPEGRARQMGWVHRTCRPFHWNDRTIIGRAASGSEDGNPRRAEEVDKKGNVVSWKDKLTEGLTDREGYADLCWDAKEARFLPRNTFNNYLDKKVPNPAQRSAVKQVFTECANRNAREMARQGQALHSGLDEVQATLRYSKANTVWAMIRLEDLSNTHMAIKRRTGIAMRDPETGQTMTNGRGEAEPFCDPKAPCTESTFVCAKLDKDESRTGTTYDIKNKVAEYVTIYSHTSGAPQYVETGTYRKPDIDSKTGRQKTDSKSDDGLKWKYEHCPVSMNIFEADDAKPFLELSKPQVVRDEHSTAFKIATAGIGALHKPKQSVVYNAVEHICPAGSVDANRPKIKVVARKNGSGEVDSGVYACDSADGVTYRPWMSTQEPTKLERNGDEAGFKDLKMVNHTTGALDTLNLTFNANSVGLCLWRWSDTNRPAHLVPQKDTARVQGSIRNNTRTLPGTRGIQSTDKPQVVEEPKK